MKLYKHQQQFIDRNPDKAMLVWETQTGKTFTACEWIKKRPTKRILISCPKAIVGKWERDLKTCNAIADVATRDEIKKINLDEYDGLILDEAQDYSSPLFDKSRSKRAEVIYNYVKRHRNAPILLLTATPVRSTPWNIHTLACYLGVFWPIKEFREKFFYLTDKFGRHHYEKKKGWQKMIRPYVESISDIVLMSDCVDVPTQHHKLINIPWTKKQTEELKLQEYQEPVAEWHARHRLEQGDPKWKEIKKLIDGYRKVIIVCHYTSQIDDYIKRIGSDRLVYVLDGRTKDQDAVIEEAKASDDVIFLVQAQMGAGFSASEFSSVIFASMPFSYVFYVQMLGRTKVISDLHENIFYYFVGGKCDEAVYDTINDGKNFDPISYLARSPQKIGEEGSENNTEGSQMVPEELPF